MQIISYYNDHRVCILCSPTPPRCISQSESNLLYINCRAYQYHEHIYSFWEYF